MKIKRLYVIVVEDKQAENKYIINDVFAQKRGN